MQTVLGTEAFGKPVGTAYSASSRLCTRSGIDIYIWLGMPAGAAMPLMWADAKYIKVRLRRLGEVNWSASATVVTSILRQEVPVR